MSLEELKYSGQTETHEKDLSILNSLQGLNIANESRVSHTMTAVVSALNDHSLTKKDFFDMIEAEGNKVLFPAQGTPDAYKKDFFKKIVAGNLETSDLSNNARKILAQTYLNISANKPGDIKLGTVNNSLSENELVEAINIIDEAYAFTETETELSTVQTQTETKTLQEDIEQGKSGFPGIETLSNESIITIHKTIKEYLKGSYGPKFNKDEKNYERFMKALGTAFVGVDKDYTFFSRYASVNYTGATIDEGSRSFMLNNAREQGKNYQMLKYGIAVAMYQEMVNQGIKKENIVFDPDAGSSYLTQRQQEGIAFEHDMKEQYVLQEVQGLFEDSELKKQKETVDKYFGAIDEAANKYYTTDALKKRFRSNDYPKYCELQSRQARIHKEATKEWENSIKSILDTYISEKKNKEGGTYTVSKEVEMLKSFSVVDALMYASLLEEKFNTTHYLTKGEREAWEVLHKSMGSEKIKGYYNNLSGLVNGNGKEDGYGKVAYQNMTDILSKPEVLAVMPSKKEFAGYKTYRSKVKDIHTMSYNEIKTKYVANKKKSAPYGYYTEQDLQAEDKNFQKYAGGASFTGEQPDPKANSLYENQSYKDMGQMSQDLFSKNGQQFWIPILSALDDMKIRDILSKEQQAQGLKNASTLGYLAATVGTGMSNGLFTMLTGPYKGIKGLDLMFRSDQYKLQQQEDWYKGSFLGSFVENANRPALFDQFWKTDAIGNQTNSVNLINLPGMVTKQLSDMVLLLGGANLVSSKLAPSLLSMGAAPQLVNVLSNVVATMAAGSYLHLGEHLDEAREAGMTGVSGLNYAMYVTIVEAGIESAGGLTAMNFLEEQTIKTMTKTTVKGRLKALGGVVKDEVLEEIVNQSVMDTHKMLLNDTLKTKFNIGGYQDYIQLIVLTSLTSGLLAGGDSKSGGQKIRDAIDKNPVEQNQKISEILQTYEKEGGILSESQSELFALLSKSSPELSSEDGRTAVPEDKRLTSQEELYPQNEKLELRNARFAKAFATMSIEQSPERNEQAFQALKQAHPNSESFLDANKDAILKIIETAHNNRNQRDESKAPLWTDLQDPDNKLYPMMEEDFVSEKNYILTEIGKLPGGDLTKAREIMITLMREGWCGKLETPGLEAEWKQLRKYKNEALETQIKEWYGLIDTNEKLVSTESDNFEALTQLDAYLRDYFEDIIKQAYGDKYQDTELWTMWTLSYNGQNYDEIVANQNAIESKIFQMVLGKKTSIDKVRTLLESVRRQRVKRKAEGDQEIFIENNRDILKELELLGVQINDIAGDVPSTVLPTDSRTLKEGSGNGIERIKGNNYAKIRAVVEILQGLGVDMSTVKLNVGKNLDNMMREQSYFTFYIPSLNRTVFVTNEYGEASFVYEGEVTKEIFTAFTKDEIMFLAMMEKVGGKKIEFTPDDVAGWKMKMKYYLENKIPIASVVEPNTNGQTVVESADIVELQNNQELQKLIDAQEKRETSDGLIDGKIKINVGGKSEIEYQGKVYIVVSISNPEFFEYGLSAEAVYDSFIKYCKEKGYENLTSETDFFKNFSKDAILIEKDKWEEFLKEKKLVKETRKAINVGGESEIQYQGKTYMVVSIGNKDFAQYGNPQTIYLNFIKYCKEKGYEKLISDAHYFRNAAQEAILIEKDKREEFIVEKKLVKSTKEIISVDGKSEIEYGGKEYIVVSTKNKEFAKYGHFRKVYDDFIKWYSNKGYKELTSDKHNFKSGTHEAKLIEKSVWEEYIKEKDLRRISGEFIRLDGKPEIEYQGQVYVVVSNSNLEFAKYGSANTVYYSFIKWYQDKGYKEFVPENDRFIIHNHEATLIEKSKREEYLKENGKLLKDKLGLAQGSEQDLISLYTMLDNKTELEYTYIEKGKQLTKKATFADVFGSEKKYSGFARKWNELYPNQQIPLSPIGFISKLVVALTPEEKTERKKMGVSGRLLKLLFAESKKLNRPLTIKEAQALKKNLENNGQENEITEESPQNIVNTSLDSLKENNPYIRGKMSFVEDVVVSSYDADIYDLIESKNQGLELEQEMIDIFLYMIKPSDLESKEALFSYVLSINNEFSLALSQEQVDLIVDEFWKGKKDIRFDETKLNEYNNRIKIFNDKRKEKSPSLVDIANRFPQIRKFENSFDQCAAQGVLEFAVVSYGVDGIIIAGSKGSDFKIQSLCVKIARNDKGLSLEIENHLLIQKIHKELNNPLIEVPKLVDKLSNAEHMVMQYFKGMSMKGYLILDAYKDKLINLKTIIDTHHDHPLVKAIYERTTKYKYVSDTDILRNLSESDVKNILLLQGVTEGELAVYQMPTTGNRRQDFVDVIAYINKRDGLALSPDAYYNAYESFVSLLRDKGITDIDSHLGNVMIYTDHETQEVKIGLIDFGKISFSGNEYMKREDLLDQYNITRNR